MKIAGPGLKITIDQTSVLRSLAYITNASLQASQALS